MNPDRVGHRYAPYRFEVGREHVRTYADVTGVTDARYGDDDPQADCTGLAVPPAFVACIAGARAWRQVMADPGLRAHARVVHGGQELEFAQPVRIGDVLICTPTITDLRSMRGMDLLTVEVTCARPDGAAVVTSRSRLAFLPEGT